jgi:serine/threonine-protein kinase
VTITSGTILGRYEIRSKLGEGGMGEVFLAQDTKLDRKVALKVLPADVASDPDRMRRFVQEAKAASALNHPNIITIHEIDQTDSIHFIATEYIEGETLRQRMRDAPMKLGAVLDVAIQVARALSAAHAAGIAHRDIKPENIMIRRDTIVKVLDFGLAKLTERAPPDSVDTEAPTRTGVKTEPGVVMGTAFYMSPEQARGVRVDARTDIFSLGVLIYEMVAGRLPFAGSNTNEIIASILSDKQPLPLARYARQVPSELERIAAKALSKEREERYQSAKDLLIDLGHLKKHLEVEAELERSRSPDISANQAAVSGTSSTVRGQAAQTSTITESFANRIKGNRRVLTIALTVLILAVAGLIYLFYVARPGRTIDSIAVLPLAHANTDPDAEYLSDGITEGIINKLSALPQLRVMARNTVFTYKGKEVDARKVGQDLGVGAVLTGRLSRRDDHMILGLELVSVSDGRQLWGQRYDGKDSDVLTMQQDIAQEVSDRLQLKLSGEEKQQLARDYTRNVEAYQLYLKGRYFWSKFDPEGLKKSIEYYNQALDKDPNYALAYAGIADAYSVLANGYLRPRDNYPKSAAAVNKALELDPGLYEAQLTQAFIKFFYEWDWPAVERQVRRLQERNPNDPNVHTLNAYYLLTMGRRDEALAESKRALDLDPLATRLTVDLATNLCLRGQYDEAIKLLRETLETDPNSMYVHLVLGRAYDLKGSYQEAVANYNEVIRLIGRDPCTLSYLGRAYAMSGNRAEAQRLLGELTELSKQTYVFPLCMVYIYVGLGENEQGFKWLEKAYEEKDSNLVVPGIRFDPMLDPLRSDPRYADLLRRMNLSPN